MPSPTPCLTRDAGIVRYNSFGRGVRDLSHSLGLEVQDSRDYSVPLEVGMVFTIEPKIYIPERSIAIVIEDMIVVTPYGLREPVSLDSETRRRHQADRTRAALAALLRRGASRGPRHGRGRESPGPSRPRMVGSTASPARSSHPASSPTNHAEC